jgi:hypothetical protein
MSLQLLLLRRSNVVETFGEMQKARHENDNQHRLHPDAAAAPCA